MKVWWTHISKWDYNTSGTKQLINNRTKQLPKKGFEETKHIPLCLWSKPLVGYLSHQLYQGWKNNNPGAIHLEVLIRIWSDYYWWVQQLLKPNRIPKIYGQKIGLSPLCQDNMLTMGDSEGIMKLVHIHIRLLHFISINVIA